MCTNLHNNINLHNININKMLAEFDNICRKNDWAYWLNFETLQSILTKKSNVLQSPIKVSMLRENYEHMWAKIDASEYLYSLVSQRKANITTKIYHREFPKDLYIEVIPYDYVDVDFCSKNDVKNLNKEIKKLRKILVNIEKDKEEKEDLINYLNLYKKDILNNRQTTKNALVVGLDCDCNEKDRIINVDRIFPLINYEFNQINLYIPAFANKQKEKY